MPRRPAGFALLRIVSAGLVAAAAVAPLAWLLWQILADPLILRLLHPASIRWDILGRTAGYAAAVAALATLLAAPVGVAVGRGGGWIARLLGWATPVTLLLPSIAYAYGWEQAVWVAAEPAGRWLSAAGVDRQMLLGWGVLLSRQGDSVAAVLLPTGPADVARCVITLAGWLWPIPAMAIAATLRRADPDIRAQAILDGAGGRLTLRQTLTPAVMGALAVWLLAGQEFAVYEPTGISVVATEVRQVFETGAFSSPMNPIAQPMIGGGGGVFGTPVGVVPGEGDLQARAAAAAVATAGPMLLLTAILGVAVAWMAARWSAAAGDDPAYKLPPVRPPKSVSLLGLLVLLLTVGVPLAALLLRHHRPLRPWVIWKQSGPQVLGSFWVAILAGVSALPLVLGGLRRLPRWSLAVLLTAFLVGGQLLAIALIRLYNRPGLEWIYHFPPILVLAYLGRFGWIPMLAAGATWNASWRRLREQAATDGATAADAARWIIGPMARPLVIGSAALVLVLSLTEVPATVLATPHRPPQIVPMLMTWVHIQQSDPMIEASLLLLVVSAVLAAAATLLVAAGLRRGRDRQVLATGQSPKPAGLVRSARAMLPALLLGACCIAGCRDPAQPDAVWLTAGTGPGQTVYPRAVDYNTTDDTFVLIDRVGRVQRFDQAGQYLSEWQMPETQAGKPVGVTFGPDGNIYVPDTHYHRVMVYSTTGQLVRQWGSFGREPGQFIFPTDIAFDAAGRVFVAEYGENDRIQVFDSAGKFLYQFGRFGEKDGEFSRPQSLLIYDGLVYVTDACNHRISVFRTDGTFVRNMGAVGSNLGEFRFPYGLAMDAEGRLIVCEFGNNRVQWIDRQTGQGLKTWGAAGRAIGQLAYPWAVAVDKRGRVMVVDAGNNRVQIVRF